MIFNECNHQERTKNPPYCEKEGFLNEKISYERRTQRTARRLTCEETFVHEYGTIPFFYSQCRYYKY
ncbi:putative glycosyltransferase [Bacillus sp. TS-2]|nr:putative glycosyltransferase [Bacillus sp. TS-2]